jgi:hypothetical protein
MKYDEIQEHSAISMRDVKGTNVRYVLFGKVLSSERMFHLGRCHHLTGCFIWGDIFIWGDAIIWPDVIIWGDVIIWIGVFI